MKMNFLFKNYYAATHLIDIDFFPIHAYFKHVFLGNFINNPGTCMQRLPHFLSGTSHFLIKIVLLLICISVFVPFSPKMPAPGLDPSWALALNQAIAQGLSFGKEIIFTLGPYSSIYTKAYHPVIDHLMVMGCLYLALTYWLGLIALLKSSRMHWTLAFCVLLFLMIYSRDALFFSYPLLTGLVCFKSLSVEEPPKHTPFLIALLFVSFGLLSLVKGSVLALCVAVSVLCFIYFMAHTKKILATLALCIPISSLIFFWLVIGQSLSNIPPYFINTVSLISGFSEAMSVDGNENEIILFLLNAFFLFAVIACQKHMPRNTKLFLLSLFFVFLLLALKTGFTRHYGHALIPGTSILIAALFLLFISKTRMIYVVIMCSFGTWYYISSHYTQISFYKNFMSSYTATWYGIKNRLNNKLGLKQDFDISMEFLNQQTNFPELQGTTDIYSYNQSYLIASNNKWQPRPIFQSYSVFNAVLAEKNKQHLQGIQQPDNIIFKIEPIDERIPSLEDGASWPILLADYHPIELKNNFLILRKNEGTSPTKSVNVTSEQHKLGELVKLPPYNRLIFAEIALKPTFWGHVATLLLKPQQLEITYLLKDGTQKNYRIIANMAQSGFLISPLIENTAEFALLYNDNLKDKMVQSFTISIQKGTNWQWNNEYTVRYNHIKKPHAQFLTN